MGCWGGDGDSPDVSGLHGALQRSRYHGAVRSHLSVPTTRSNVHCSHSSASCMSCAPCVDTRTSSQPIYCDVRHSAKSYARLLHTKLRLRSDCDNVFVLGYASPTLLQDVGVRHVVATWKPLHIALLTDAPLHMHVRMLTRAVLQVATITSDGDTGTPESDSASQAPHDSPGPPSAHHALD